MPDALISYSDYKCNVPPFHSAMAGIIKNPEDLMDLGINPASLMKSNLEVTRLQPHLNKWKKGNRNTGASFLHVEPSGLNPEQKCQKEAVLVKQRH